MNKNEKSLSQLKGNCETTRGEIETHIIVNYMSCLGICITYVIFLLSSWRRWHEKEEKPWRPTDLLWENILGNERCTLCSVKFSISLIIKIKSLTNAFWCLLHFLHVSFFISINFYQWFKIVYVKILKYLAKFIRI